MWMGDEVEVNRGKKGKAGRGWGPVERGGESRTKKRVRVVVGIYEAGREAPEDNA